MTGKRKIWLVTNAGSGSVREELLANVDDVCAEQGVRIAARSHFPNDSIPSREDLSALGVETVVTLGGDGTINAVVSALAGWDGAILPLPGGTQNLTPKRLHAEASAEEVFAAWARGDGRRVRLQIIRARSGMALAGVLVGPGTSWNDVREALRDGDPGGMLGAVGAAIEGTAGNSPVRIVQPEAGDREGYPLVELVPHGNGLDVVAYHARTGADFAGHTWALLRQEFREGPHESYGPFEKVTLASTDGEPLDLLLDGEPADGDTRETFSLDTWPVDLIATQPDDAT